MGLSVCPHCHRRLLSHASAKCNWCGQVIADAEYQAQAQVNREAFLAEQAAHDAMSMAEMAALLNPSPVPVTGVPLLDMTVFTTRRERAFAARLRAEQEALALERLEAQALAQSAPAPEPVKAPEPAPAESAQEQNPEAGRFSHLEL